MAQQLVTPEELASALQSDLDLSTANMLIEMATGIVQSACGQLLIEAIVTELVDITMPDYWLELSNKPVRSVDSVVLDGTTITDWSLRKQKLWRAGGWLLSYSPPSQAEVTYTYGYPSGSQYLQLARSVTLSLAQAGYGNPGQVKGEQIDDYRVTYADALGRMELTDSMRQALINAYGSPAVVTVSEVE